MYDVGDLLTPDQAMRYAIETAKLGLGMVSPNPLVGCVIVDKNHRFVSAGAHLRYGGPHAEINAFSAVTNPQLLEGGTLYVTLEPCSHHGKTPPCSEAIITSPISQVCIGTLDPYRSGVEALRAAGKKVVHFSQYESDIKKMAEQFFFHMGNQRPFVALKVGASLDGKIALSNGESQWITGSEARLYARELRAHYDATMIGAGTLRHDNPTLDYRETSFHERKQNKIVILDPKGQAAQSFKETTVYKTHGAQNIFILTGADYIHQWSEDMARVVNWEPTTIGWEDALQELYEEKIYSLYVEGGAYVFGQILTHSLAQKLYLFQSTKILGQGKGWSDLFENRRLADVPELRSLSSIKLGADSLSTGYFY